MNKIDNNIKKLVENNAVALATVGEDGNPCCIAVGFVKVIGNEILITNNYMANTVKNIEGNPNITLCVWNRNWEEECEGYELRGNAKYFKKGEWYDIVRKMPENKDMPCKGAILIKIKEIKKLA